MSNGSEKLLLPPLLPGISESKYLPDYRPIGYAAFVAAEQASLADLQSSLRLESAIFAESMNYKSVSDFEDTGRLVPLAGVLRGEAEEYSTAAAEHTRTSQDKLRKERGYFASLDERLRGHEDASVMREKITAYIRTAPSDTRSAYMKWSESRNVEQSPNTSPIDELTWLSQTSDDELLGFLVWHNKTLQQINNDPVTIERIRMEKEAFKAGIRAVVKKGLPDAFLHKLSAIDEVTVVIWDPIDLALRNSHGLYNLESNQVALEPDYRQATINHEFAHVLGRLPRKIHNEVMADFIADMAAGREVETNNILKTEVVRGYSFHSLFMKQMFTSGKRQDLLPYALEAFIEADPTGHKNMVYESVLYDSYDGINVEDFVRHQFDTAERLAQEGANRETLSISNYLLMYAGRGFLILGALQNGFSKEMIISWHADGPVVSALPEREREKEINDYAQHIDAVDQYLRDQAKK